jgi:hypothetical protein
MNLDHYTTSTHPTASDLNRVFEGSRRLQIGQENRPLDQLQLLDEAQGVLSNFTAGNQTSFEPSQTLAAPVTKSRILISRKSFVAGSCLLLLALALGRPAQEIVPSSPSGLPPFEMRQRHEQASLAAINATKRAEAWSGESRAGAIRSTHVSTLKTADTLSVRVNMKGSSQSETEFTLCSAETDPTILPEVSSKRWSGSVPIYISLCRGTENVSIVGEAAISIREDATSVAELKVQYPSIGGPLTATSTQAQALLGAGFALSLKESVNLARSNDSL